MADKLEDIILRHQVYLQRLVPQLGAEQIAMIDKNNPELRGELIQFLEDNEFYKLTKEQQNKLAVFRNKVYKLRGDAINEAGEKYQGDMLDLAEREQMWLADGVEDLGGKSLAVSSSSALAKMVERQPFVGKTLNQIYTKLSVDDTDRIMTSVSDGLNSGLTKQQIQNQIFGTKKLGYTDGILQQTRNYINNNNTNSGVVRTTVNGISNESKRLLYEANSDIIDKVQYMSTLDGRTSNICASRDGKIYKQGSEPPLPAHINCRSTYVPIIDGLDIESTRPYVADTRTRKEREKDFREQAKANGTTIKQERDKWKNKAIGQVSDKTTYQQWFDKQPASFQKEKLGKTKYELYKKGGMKFDRFQDPLNKSYTIDELYKLDKNAFKKAGLGKGGKVLPKPAKKRTIKKEVVLPIDKPEFRKELIAVEDKIYTKEVEHGYVFDNKGNKIAEEVGGKGAVAFKKSDWKKAKDGLVTHNHPINASFSPDDIKAQIKYGVKEMRATTESATYQMILKDATKIGDETWQDIIDINFFTYEKKWGKKAKDMYKRGELTAKNANEYALDGIWGDIMKNKEWQKVFSYAKIKRK